MVTMKLHRTNESFQEFEVYVIEGVNLFICAGFVHGNLSMLNKSVLYTFILYEMSCLQVPL